MKLNDGMRRTDRAMEKETAERILGEAGWGFLSINDPEGYGYGVPVNYLYADGCIYIHGATEGKKTELIRRDPRVGFTIVDRAEVAPDLFSTRYRSVMVFGKAEPIGEEEEKKRILREFIRRFSPEYLEKGMEYVERAGAGTLLVRIRIEKMTAKERR